ncbi:MAG TPA: alpha/beta fold hydrolase [Polyangiaceae bacterium]|jgi:pimeloyl-ACP methyl ester carboxylesterase|nr:alpha/beta fold hydrolase [Polyangiaceae bacterium]
MKNVRWMPLGIVILWATLGCSSSDGERAPVPKTFVLVHGSWMGAWCWDEVAAGLRAKGVTVVTVELPAHGSDTTPLPGATLDAYVAKVSDAVDATEGPVILVGHSMAGMVVTQVAENKTDKIAKLVYVAAYLPKDGEALLDLAMTDTDSHSGMNVTIDMADGLAKIPEDDLKDDFLADGSPAELATLQAHYRDEPLAPFVTPVHTTVANWGRLPKVYVYTKDDHAVSYTLQQRMTAGVTFVSTATLDTSHAPFLSQPGLVTSTLLAL